jgi:cytochrome d ubiquinol oxidase subunit I
MGTSLAFHIIFAALGVGVPFLAFTAEGIGILKKDRTWYTLAKRWGKAFGILYAIGAVSGTILSFELGLLWPTFMKFSGSIIGLPFALEAFAFFLEAIFLAVYIFGWDKLPPIWHWLSSVPLWVGGFLSSIFVVSANAWMNTPTGFQYKNGKLSGIDPIAAMLNPSALSETMHMTFAAYAATGAGVAAIYAIALLRGKQDTYNRRGLLLGMGMSLIGMVATGYFGDMNGQVVAKYQPAKYAAMEGLFHTTRGAPETILGFPNPATMHTYFAIKIDGLGAWLAFRNQDATVKGLDAFPRDQWPVTSVIHWTFDIMVGIGFLAIFFGLYFWFRYLFKRGNVFESKLILWGAAAIGPLAFLAIELGWMTTEMGRQPWVVYGYVLTKDAVTPAPALDISFLIFSCIYVALAIATIIFLLRLRRMETDEETQPHAPHDTGHDTGHDVSEHRRDGRRRGMRPAIQPGSAHASGLLPSDGGA